MLSLLSPIPPPPPRLPRFAGSAMAHIAMVALTMALSRYLVVEDELIDWSRFRVEPISLRLSEPIFFAAPAPAAGSAAPAPAAVVAHRTSKPGPTVVGSDYLPAARLPKTVPPVMHWSAAAPPPPNRVITPGRVEPPSPPPQLTAPPSLPAAASAAFLRCRSRIPRLRRCSSPLGLACARRPSMWQPENQ